MAAKKRIFISRKQSRDQNLKNHFPKGIFQWDLARSKRTWKRLHFWNTIWKKKKNIILLKNGGQNKFCDIVQ